MLPVRCASELAVHGRTKEDGYRGEAIKWEWIARIRERLSIPVIANGEIWSHVDGVRCRQVTGCADLMVGRGALNVLNLRVCRRGGLEAVARSSVTLAALRRARGTWR